MTENNNEEKQPEIGARITDDGAMVFDANDGITIRARYVSDLQVKIDMWREADGCWLADDTGNIGTKSFRDRLAESARKEFNPPPGKREGEPKDTIPNIEVDLGRVSKALGIPEIADLLKPESAPTLVDRLIDSVNEVGTLFTTPEGRAHVALRIDGHTETYDVDETRFRTWLRGYFYKTESKRLEAQAAASYERMIETMGALVGGTEIPVKRPPVLRDQTIADAISQLKSIALYEGRVEEVHLRVGERGGKFYLDLGTELWDAVEVDSDGWRIVQNPPVRFVRAAGTLPLPYPTGDGSIEDLRGLLTLGDGAEDEKSWRLILAWLIQALRPGAGHYPILILLGGQGTAKSTTSRMLRNIIDPNTVEDTGEPRGVEGLHIDASCSWVLAYDNLAKIREWLSNALCRIATGAAFTTRTFYTNRDREIFKARQPQIMNGISEVATRGDILDRALLVNLPVIEEYREEADVWAEFHEAHPGILGALLDATSAGLKSIESGEAIADKLPRLADFARWAIRTEKALGGKKGDFMRAHTDSKYDATATVLEAEPISHRLYQFARTFSEDAAWVGTGRQLLDILNERETDDAVKRGRDWPSAANVLTGLINRLAPDLAKHGVHFERINKSNREGRKYKLYYREPEGGDDASGDTVPTVVPTEEPIDKPDTANGDDRDDGELVM